MGKLYIYKTTNKINGKIYIGQTAKDGVALLEYLGSGYVLMKAIARYGKENFIKEILEVCDSKEVLNEREVYWINLYGSTNRRIGYNVSIGGNGGNLGEEVNKKISNKLKGWVSVRDKEGKIFKVRCGHELILSGELVGINSGRVPHNKGLPMSESQKQKIRKPKTKEHRMNLSKARIGKMVKPIVCINNGLEYDSIKDAAYLLGLTVPNIVEVLKGRARHTKNFVFKYINKSQDTKIGRF